MTEVAEVTRRIPLPNEAATRRLAEALARRAERGDAIALAGALGAGKTTFARAFIHALAAAHDLPAEDVPSPTFTLVQVYEFPAAPVYHFDFYRIEKAEEAWELGIEEAFADAISLIEWPDRVAPLLPASRLDLALLPGPAPGGRIAELTGRGAWMHRLRDLDADG